LNGGKPSLLTGANCFAREEAEALGYEDEPYDALLDAYEQGETVKGLQPVFNILTQALVRLLERIKGSSKRTRTSLEERRFPIADQESFAIEVAKRIGYNFQGGRLDVSAHPFTTGLGPGDVRTARTRNDLARHSLPLSMKPDTGFTIRVCLSSLGLLFCRPISLGINESPSMWENLVRVYAVWEHFYAQAQTKFVSLRDFLEILLTVNK
jgi:carboxypeptidase Taq